MIGGSRAAAGAAPAAGPYRVMVVDDSAVIRGIISRWIEADPSFRLVGSASNGVAALQQIERMAPEVVVLDIEMPQMDGLTALPRLLAAVPGVKVIMASTLTLRNADISLKALAAGASDYVPKPTSVREGGAVEIFQRELLEKLKVLGAACRRQAGAPAVAPTAPAAPGRPRHEATVAARAAAPRRGPLALRAFSRTPPQVVAIGSSTGGPQALFQLFGELKSSIRLPILITQHMPPTFTTILADHLKRISGAPCSEATDGEPVLPGHIYLARGDWHMTVQEEQGLKRLRLNQNPPENFCRPAVDPMLRSLARVYGSQVLVIVLTGMGQDGLAGGREIVAAGGSVVAQDEASSVIWGMPGAVAQAGLCSSVLPLSDIASLIKRMAGGGAPT